MPKKKPAPKYQTLPYYPKKKGSGVPPLSSAKPLGPFPAKPVSGGKGIAKPGLGKKKKIR